MAPGGGAAGAGSSMGGGRGKRLCSSSTVITTNTPFSDWGNVLYNTTIATAIADRLVENSEIFLLGGDSLRKGNSKSNPPAAE